MILIGLGTNLVLGVVFVVVAGHYSRTLRTILEGNREMMRNVWAQAAAREPSAPLTGSLANAAAGAARQEDTSAPPEFRRSLLEEDALLNNI